MTTADLHQTVPATADLDDADHWREYLKVCKLHRNSPTYEATEAAAWATLQSKLGGSK